MKAKHIFTLFTFLALICLFFALVGGAVAIGSLSVKAEWASTIQIRPEQSLFIYPDATTGELVLVLASGEYTVTSEKLEGCYRLIPPEKDKRGRLVWIGATCPNNQ